MMAFSELLSSLLVLISRICVAVVEYLWRCIVPRQKKSVSGEIVVITGAGHGMGKEMAHMFSKLGAKVALLDISKEGLEEVATKIQDEGGFARSYQCDVRNETMVTEVAQRIESEIGDVTVLINNAGILNGQDLLLLSMEKVQRTFDINIVAYIRMVKVFMPKMLEMNHGHIINIASMSAVVPVPYMVDYSSSKFAVNGFSRGLREEIRQVYKRNVKISCVFPFFVATGIVHTMKPGRVGRIMTPEEAAQQIVDGVLREEEDIFIPKYYRFFSILAGCLPNSVCKALGDFTAAGIEPVDAEASQ